MGGALAHHADEIVDGLGDEDRDAIREILLRLVTGKQTRQVLGRSRLLDGLPEHAGTVLDRLIEGRLVVARKSRSVEDETTQMELSHGSLIDTWPLLRSWIDEGREDLRFLDEVGRAAELWQQRGGRDDEVWQGEPLHDALRRARDLPRVPRATMRFLEAGREREHRGVRRRQVWLAAGLVTVLVVAAILAILTHTARQQRNLAVEKQRIADQRGVELLLHGARRALEDGDAPTARAQVRSALVRLCGGVFPRQQHAGDQRRE